MVADSIPNTPTTEVAYHVGHRKYNIDKRCPWWQRFFFRWIYLPFVRFSFKYMHIPAMDEVEINGKTMVFCWYEDGGVFDDEDRAAIACQDEFSRVKPIYKNRVYPPETAQAFGQYYPRAGKPRRYQKPNYDLTAIPTKEVEQIRSEVIRLHRKLESQ